MNQFFSQMLENNKASLKIYYAKECAIYKYIPA